MGSEAECDPSVAQHGFFCSRLPLQADWPKILKLNDIGYVQNIYRYSRASDMHLAERTAAAMQENIARMSKRIYTFVRECLARVGCSTAHTQPLRGKLSCFLFADAGNLSWP